MVNLRSKISLYLISFVIIEFEKQLKFFIVLRWLVGRYRDRKHIFSYCNSSYKRCSHKVDNIESSKVWNNFNRYCSVLSLNGLWVAKLGNQVIDQYIFEKFVILYPLKLLDHLSNSYLKNSKEKRKYLGSKPIKIDWLEIT
jgi:hypothetical protein